MVYTVTFNPAIDYIVKIDNIERGMVNRTDSEEYYLGGKGINVSIMLNELGVESKALGFVSGFTGDAIEKGIGELGINTDFVHLAHGISRINVKIKSGEETDLNAQGPEIEEKHIEELYSKLEEIKDGDILVLAGSIPPSLPSDMYERILDRLHDRDIKIVVDATKDLLMRVLKYKPFLIKPNNYELEELFNVKLESDEDIVKYARELKNMGAVNVLVSMAKDGAILIDEFDQVHRRNIFDGKLVNSVGAGDSMVAGFIAGSMTGDYAYALKLGTAAGGSTAFSAGIGTKEFIDELLSQEDGK